MDFDALSEFTPQFGPEIGQGDGVLLRMLDNLAWWTPLQEQMQELSEKYRRTLEALAAPLVVAVERMAAWFAEEPHRG